MIPDVLACFTPSGTASPTRQLTERRGPAFPGGPAGSRSRPRGPDAASDRAIPEAVTRPCGQSRTPSRSAWDGGPPSVPTKPSVLADRHRRLADLPEGYVQNIRQPAYDVVRDSCG
jgi:hypothetical protein